MVSDKQWHGLKVNDSVGTEYGIIWGRIEDFWHSVDSQSDNRGVASPDFIKEELKNLIRANNTTANKCTKDL